MQSNIIGPKASIKMVNQISDHFDFVFCSYKSSTELVVFYISCYIPLIASEAKSVSDLLYVAYTLAVALA